MRRKKTLPLATKGQGTKEQNYRPIKPLMPLAPFWFSYNYYQGK